MKSPGLRGVGPQPDEYCLNTSCPSYRGGAAPTCWPFAGPAPAPSPPPPPPPPRAPPLPRPSVCSSAAMPLGAAGRPAGAPAARPAAAPGAAATSSALGFRSGLRLVLSSRSCAHGRQVACQQPFVSGNHGAPRPVPGSANATQPAHARRLETQFAACTAASAAPGPCQARPARRRQHESCITFAQLRCCPPWALCMRQPPRPRAGQVSTRAPGAPVPPQGPARMHPAAGRPSVLNSTRPTLAAPMLSVPMRARCSRWLRPMRQRRGSAATSAHCTARPGSAAVVSSPRMLRAWPALDRRGRCAAGGAPACRAAARRSSPRRCTGSPCRTS